jgi:hypothetical protein
MDQNQTKIDEITRKFGFTLIDYGIRLLQMTFRGLKVSEFTYDQVKNFVLNAGLNIPLNQFDNKYYTTDWDSWQLLIDTVILDRALYLTEKRDCDNFAFLFTSLASFLTGLNTCGAALGMVYNKDTGALIAGHYFNIIVTSDGRLYCFDTLNYGFCQIEKGKPIIINGWRYEVKNITFF